MQAPHDDTQARHAEAWRANRAAGGLRTLCAIIALIVIMLVQPGAQSLNDAAVVHRASTAVASTQVIELLVGRSTVLPTTRPITRVSLSTPEIADALVTESNQVLIHGKAPGTISLLVWDGFGRIDGYEVVVQRDLSNLEEQLRRLFPDEPISVASNGTDVVISGIVSSMYVVDNAAAVAAGYVDSAENVVNLLRQQEGEATDQIMLRVRFAEVSRTAVQELGASFFTSIFGKDNWVGRLTTQQFAAPEFDNEDGLVFSDFLNIFAFNQQENVGTVIRAMASRGLLQSLAEPNLITQNGTEASFLAGGEFPFPVIQGSGAQSSVTIQFKEFGVRLRFTPTLVGGDRINLQIEPEVSSLDFANAVSVEGFRIPALTTRRTNTAVELRDGQTFAVAGLLDNTVTEQIQKIPGLGDIPILGLLFRSRAYQKSNTELVVMVTPHIVREGEMGVTGELPRLAQPFLEEMEGPLPPPPAFFGPGGVGSSSRPSGGPERETDVAQVAIDAAQPVPVAPAADPRAVEAERRAVERQARAELKRAAEDAKRQAELEGKQVEEARRQAERDRKGAEKQARADATRAAEDAKRQAELEGKQVVEARRQAERDRKAAEKQARADATRAAEDAKRQAELEGKQVVEARRQAERDRKAAEKQARVDAKRAAEDAKRQAELERTQVEEARKQGERDRKAAEHQARADAKRAAEDAKRQAELERTQAEEAREQAARDRKEAEARAKLAVEAAERQAKLARKQAEHDRKRARALDKERDEREVELKKLLDKYLPKLAEAQRALDEIDDERSVLVTPRPGDGVQESTGATQVPAR